MYVQAIKTHRVEPRESLEKILDQYVLSLDEGDILAITSKILSLCQGRFVPKEKISKYDLIRQEADLMIEGDQNLYDLYLTIKDGILIPSAGIDESNALDMYILYPENTQKTAFSLWNYLRTKHSLQTLGIIITDSHTTPMRRGVTGIGLGWCGFEPLYSYVNKPDIYGKPLSVTQVNILDSLATSAVFVMGEGDEHTPLAIIKHAPKISFTDRPPSPDEEKKVFMSMTEDLYWPFLQGAKWVPNSSNLL